MGKGEREGFMLAAVLPPEDLVKDFLDRQAQEEAQLTAAVDSASKRLEELSGDPDDEWRLTMPVLRRLALEYLHDPEFEDQGKPRDKGTLKRCLKMVRDFLIWKRRESAQGRIAELQQAVYARALADGLKPWQARKKVVDRAAKYDARSIARLDEREWEMTYRACVEMCFPPKYRREANAWSGRVEKASGVSHREVRLAERMSAGLPTPAKPEERASIKEGPEREGAEPPPRPVAELERLKAQGRL